MSKDPKSTYYDAGGIETLDIIKAKLTPEQWEGYLLGNALKYSCRINFKGKTAEDRIRDTEKIANYTRFFLTAYEENHLHGNTLRKKTELEKFNEKLETNRNQGCNMQQE